MAKGFTKVKENSIFIIKNPRLIFPLMSNLFSLFLGNKPLRTVEIALTYSCDYSCSYCSASEFHALNKKLLSLSELKHIVDEGISEGALHFLLTGGEPLLSNNFLRIAEYIKKRGRLCTFATGGGLLDKQMVSSLKARSIDLVEVSIDSINSKEHDSFRGKKGAFDKGMKGIKLLKKAGIKVMINFVVRKDNIHMLSHLESLSKKMGVNVNLGFSCPVGMWKGRTELLLSSKEIKLIRGYLNKGCFRWCGQTCYSAEGCSSGVEKIYVTAYGDVTPCPLIPKGFGNIRNTPLKKILRIMRKVSYFREIQGMCLPASDKKFLDYLYKSEVKSEKK